MWIPKEEGRGPRVGARVPSLEHLLQGLRDLCNRVIRQILGQ